jgi:ADP-ribosyl-[dinitrogen reductase] hydrolase
MPNYLERCSGSLIGLACGDAVGTSVEFCSRGSFAPLTDMIGGGPFQLAAGQWTDDTSMALCLAESLLSRDCFDAPDQMARYLNWWHWGYLSSTGDCFDIGMTVRSALRSYEATRNPFAGSENPSSAGNGALMRLAPVVLFFHPDQTKVQTFAVESTRTTHGAPEALDCSRLLAQVISRGLEGAPKDEMLGLSGLELSSPKVAALAAGSYFEKTEAEVFGTGYAVASLEAALWCFRTTDSFEAAVLRAANLGDDADTTAAIVGQIAGAHYGIHAIPAHWRAKLHMGAEIEETALKLGRAVGVSSNVTKISHF